MELGTRPSKRIKLDDSEHAVFDDPLLRRKASEICSLGLTGAGFLLGKVFMSWAPTASMKLRFIMQTEEENDYGPPQTERFSVVFSGACSQFFTDLALHARDEIALSLKGVQVESTGEMQRTCTLAMTLVYSEGVVMLRKHASAFEAGKIIDTWKLSQNWFDSPPPEETLRNVTLPQDNVKITKREQRRRQKAQRLQPKKMGNVIHDEPTPHDAMDKAQDIQLSDASTVNKRELSPVSTAPDGAQEMKAGLQVDTRKYPPIGEVSLGQMVDLIGVVVHPVSPIQTRMGDWCVNVKVVDSSSSIKADSTGLEAFAINCFTKQHVSWLPQPNAGDVLMLRRVQVSNVKGHLKGTAYHNRFQWAIFSSERKRVHHGDLRGTPRLEKRVDKDEVDCWTPFFDPDPPEIDYCVKLSKWWREKEGEQNRTSRESQEVHVVPTIRTGYEGVGSKRQHRLIKDTGPEVQPNGYFDCTVEVLYGYTNNNEVYSLYVTDYTKHDHISPVQANWCSPELSEYVLKMEMWDTAAKTGPTMEPGTYYAISNARMRLSKAGYLEGKVVLPKIIKLNEGDADRNPHLKDLLTRKKKWNDQYGIPSNIEDKLIEDVLEDEFFNCVVEVLHVTNSGYGPPCIYVTDYTNHPYLEASQLEGEWSKGLEGRVAKVSLWDYHASIANSVTPSFYYSIRKLRLRLNLRGDHFEGELRGHERLIQQLNPRTRSEQLQQLLRRRERFLRQANTEEHQALLLDSKAGRKSGSFRISTPKVLKRAENHSKSEDYSSQDQDAAVPNGEAHQEDHLLRIPAAAIIKEETHEETHEEVPIKPGVVTQRFTSFKEMVADETCPKKFLVRARVIDFYPFTLKECSKQFCTQCKTQIPAKYKACIGCSDTEHEFVTHRYQILLRLEDNEGTRIIVLAYDKSHLFDGLERANFIDDPKAYDSFCAQLSPLLGNLVEVHESGLRGEETIPDTETHEFEIRSHKLV
ncbi:hypothetical protein AX15_006294 [Amanita polypyramis BW_CC]|nr:hypothetical protein AX15_006294 [Amanita polypyramis BW_CC]